MKTVFKVGMKVYDQLNFPDTEGIIKNINKDEYNDNFPIFVKFEEENGKSSVQSYTLDGRYRKGSRPALSTKPYKIITEGFEQKAPTPTYEEAEEWMKKEYAKGSLCLMMRDVFEALEALRKLIVLRDYYNEGWQPDWSKKNKMHFCIRVRNNKITTDSNSDINEFNTVLVFIDYTIRDKFLEEQRELLEIAKPLL